MDTNLKAKWVKALRSEKYKQGTGYLLVDGAYCCLGVLCDIQGINWDKIKHDDRNTSFLDGDLLSPYRADLDSEKTKQLAMMNDACASFSEIADYIEKHL